MYRRNSSSGSAAKLNMRRLAITAELWRRRFLLVVANPDLEEPVGAGNSVTLRNLRIFMDEAPELVPAQYPDVRAQIGQAEDDPTPWQAARAAIMPHHAHPAKSQATGPCSEF
jgi:hypothetical protein